MDATDNPGKAPERELAAVPAAEGGTAASTPGSDHRLGPDAVAILSTEHWSLIGSRSLLWNEAYSRTTIFLGALSAAIVALALVANATGLGPRTATLALVLLPVVLFLGIATHIRMVEINQAELELMLAMNRLRNAYLRIAPALEPYFSTSPHDDELGLTASYLSFHGRGLRPWGHFLSNTATVIATVDAALAAAIAVLAVRKAGTATASAVAVGAVAFLVVWMALFLLQRQSLSALRRSKPRFPTPPDESLSAIDSPVVTPVTVTGVVSRRELLMSIEDKTLAGGGTPTYVTRFDGVRVPATDYHPVWLDSLADDVTIEGSAMNGVVQGAEAVRSIVTSIRTLYESQDFNFAGPYGENGFLEDYTAQVRGGEQIGNVVLVTRDPAGQAQHIVANYRPRTALLHLSRLIGEQLAGTPYGEHFATSAPE